MVGKSASHSDIIFSGLRHGQVVGTKRILLAQIPNAYTQLGPRVLRSLCGLPEVYEREKRVAAKKRHAKSKRRRRGPDRKIDPWRGVFVRRKREYIAQGREKMHIVRKKSRNVSQRSQNRCMRDEFFAPRPRTQLSPQGLIRAVTRGAFNGRETPACEFAGFDLLSGEDGVLGLNRKWPRTPLLFGSPSSTPGPPIGAAARAKRMINKSAYELGGATL